MKKTLLIFTVIACALPLAYASLFFHRNKNETYKRDNPSDRKSQTYTSFVETNADGLPNFTWAYEINTSASVKIAVTGLTRTYVSNIACIVNKSVFEPGDYQTFADSIIFPASIVQGTNSIKFKLVLYNGKESAVETRSFIFGMIYVSPEGNDVNDGLLPATPLKNIHKGIAKAKTYGLTKIYIAKGLYERGDGLAVGYDGIVITNNNISLSGGWNADFTVQDGYSELDGMKALGRILTITSVTNLRIERLRIRRGLLISDYGAGIYMRDVAQSIITNCYIAENSSAGSGIGIFMSNCYSNMIHACSHNNEASGTGTEGIGMLVSGSAWNIIRGTYCSNIVVGMSGSSGGGIRLLNASSNNIMVSSFANNTLASPGGGISVSGNDNTIDGSYYYNIASSGGGVVLSGNRNVVNGFIYGNQCTSFEGGGVVVSGTGNTLNASIYLNSNNNVMAYGGGGISMSGASNTIGGSIYSNYSKTHAGGILVQSFSALSNITITAAVYGNTALMSGGGILLTNVINCTISADIYSNSAQVNGGGICLYGETNSINASVHENTASNGGGIFIAGVTNTVNGAVNNNSATIYGGGIFVSGNWNIINGDVYNNKVISVQNGCGGGIYYNNSAGAYWGGTITGSIYNNTAAYGGGIYHSDYTSFLVTSPRICSNTAYSNGAALYFNESQNGGGAITIRNAAITNNKGPSIIFLNVGWSMGYYTGWAMSNCTIGGVSGSAAWAISESNSSYDVTNHSIKNNTLFTNRLGGLYYNFNGSTIANTEIDTYLNVVNASRHGATNVGGNIVAAQP